MEKRYQVIIVGGGPVGVGLAVDLGQRGISCVVIERHKEPQRIPKGQNLTGRTLEHFWSWGIADELRAARAMPAGYPIGGLTAYENLMSDYWYAPPGREVVNRFYFQNNDRLPQYQLEGVLRKRAKDFPSVTTKFGVMVKKVEQTDTGVKVDVQDDGWPYEEYSIEGDYVVGCDGTRSLVRETMGIDRWGTDFDERMVLAVFRSKQLHEGLKRFPELTTYRVLRPELHGYWQFFGRVDVGEGWFFHAPVPKETRTDNYDFLGLLHQAAGFKFEAEFDHVGFWDLRVAVAEQYRKNRVFIAGDAAHSHPPYGGYGLNNGLEDIRNLGWKLQAALEGWGGETLLASYSDERRPIFVETGQAMIAGGIERDAKWLDTHNPHKDKADFEKAWAQMAADGGASVRAYEPHYEGSAVMMGPDGAVCSIHGRHTFKAEAGHHLVPQPLTNGKNVFEELGAGFTLVALGADDGAVGALEAAAKAQNVPLKTVRDTQAGGREAYEAKLLLVRPDHYVVWAGNEGPADANGLFKRVAGK